LIDPATGLPSAGGSTLGAAAEGGMEVAIVGGTIVAGVGLAMVTADVTMRWIVTTVLTRKPRA